MSLRRLRLLLQVVQMEMGVWKEKGKRRGIGLLCQHELPGAFLLLLQLLGGVCLQWRSLAPAASLQ